MTDTVTVKTRVIPQPAFSVTVRSDDSPERVAGKMLGAFYEYLKNFGTLYERRATEIRKAHDFENDVTCINASFRVGIDAEGKPGEVVHTSQTAPEVKLFSLGEIEPLPEIENPAVLLTTNQ